MNGTPNPVARNVVVREAFRVFLYADSAILKFFSRILSLFRGDDDCLLKAEMPRHKGSNFAILRARDERHCGRLPFVELLHLPEESSKLVLMAIKEAGENARDESAEIAWIWAVDEKGGRVPGRLILSGHSWGVNFSGEGGNGELQRETIRTLALAMPKAAEQVEDLHHAGCYTAKRSEFEFWRMIFKNVKTIWAYTWQSPGADYS